jgi:hypothetical protein
MAKFESALHGRFGEILDVIEDGILRGSVSASFEDGSDYASGNFRCAVRIYERYSMTGGKRVSLNVTLMQGGGEVFLSAITSGGSQALFFKLNTFGEGAFLSRLIDAVKPFRV